jgi:hypothetical protein
MAWHLAQFNVGRLVAPVGDPRVADFVDNLELVNGLGDAAPGFVWRLQTEDGDATAIRAYDDDTIVSLTVWASVEALADFAYRTDHVSFLHRRREWFEPHDEPHLAMGWVPAGHLPSVPEAVERLEHLRRHGPSPTAFTFRAPFPPPGETSMPAVDERNVCPA